MQPLRLIGKNFFRGIVLNSELPFGKNAAYELLKGETYNWRRLLLSLGRRLFEVFNRLTSDQRESVLIIDDSPYDRSRSKWVELLSSVWDHGNGRFMKGFRMLTICWSDGAGCLPMDFALLSSSDAKKRLCDSKKSMDKRCCAYQRRKEATEKATAHLETMIKRILSTGVSAQYLLMDSWFTMPATVVTLAQHLKVIGMVKKSSNIHHTFNGQSLDRMAIYRRLKKRRGRAKILASAISCSRMRLPPGWCLYATNERRTGWRCCQPTRTLPLSSMRSWILRCSVSACQRTNWRSGKTDPES